MKLSDLNKILIFIFIFNFSFNLHGEEEVDIWKNNSSNQEKKKIENNIEDSIQSPLVIKNNILTNSIIQEQTSSEIDGTLLFGIWDPDKYNFELSMWSNTDGQSIKKTISRIDKLNLSETAENIFLNTIFSYSYPPENHICNH